MIRKTLIACLWGVGIPLFVGAGYPNENSIIKSGDMPDSKIFSWHGQGERTYFILQSTDLVSWEYLPIIEVGKNTEIELGFLNTLDKVFLRLHYTDEETSDPWRADFDGDGIDNYTELLLGLNPFNVDSTLSLGVDDDADGVLNEFDAAPSDPSVGTLGVSIQAPANGTTLN